MADRQWRRGLSRTTRRPTPVEPPRQAVFDDDARLTDSRTPTEHTHDVEDLDDAVETFVAIHTFQQWIEAFRLNHPELTIPDYPPA